MPTFEAKEMNAPAKDAAAEAKKPYRVNPEHCHYTGVPHDYRCVIKDGKVNRSAGVRPPAP